MGKNRKRNNKKKNTNPSTNKSTAPSDQKEASPSVAASDNIKVTRDSEGDDTVTGSTVTEESNDSCPDKEVVSDDKVDKVGEQEAEVSFSDVAVTESQPTVTVEAEVEPVPKVEQEDGGDVRGHSNEGADREIDRVKDVAGVTGEHQVTDDVVSSEVNNQNEASVEDSRRGPDEVMRPPSLPHDSSVTQPKEEDGHDDDEDDDDDASLSDLVQQGGGEDDDYVAVTKSTSDDRSKEDASESPNSNSSFVMVAGEDEEHQHQWVDPLSLPPSSPATEEGGVGKSGGADSEDEEDDDQEGTPLRDQENTSERDQDSCQENVATQVVESNEDEDEGSGDQDCGGDGYYPDDFEDEDGVVVDEGRAIQQHLQQQMMLQARLEEDGGGDEGEDEGEDEKQEFLSLEPRVAIAVALKVVNILRKNRVLDGRSSGQIKDKIFGGDVTVLRAVEEFTTTQRVERLVSVIHDLSL